jgi:hypothetical protein
VVDQKITDKPVRSFVSRQALWVFLMGFIELLILNFRKKRITFFLKNAKISFFKIGEVMVFGYGKVI